MKFDVRGVKRIKGLVTEITGVPTLQILVKDLEIIDKSKVEGLKKGERARVWLACLLQKGVKLEKTRELMEKLLLDKDVILIPDPFRPGKQGCVNAHVYLEDSGNYVNEALVRTGFLTVDNHMTGSQFCKKLKETEIISKGKHK